MSTRKNYICVLCSGTAKQEKYFGAKTEINIRGSVHANIVNGNALKSIMSNRIKIVTPYKVPLIPICIRLSLRYYGGRAYPIWIYSQNDSYNGLFTAN